MQAAFIVFHGFDEANGITKKIRYQIDALKQCGVEVVTFYYDVDAQGVHRCMVLEHDATRPYVYHILGGGVMGSIKRRVCMEPIRQMVHQYGIDFIYMRSFHNANPFTIRLVKQLKRREGAKIVMEIPTYPYDQEYITRRMKAELAVDRLFRERLASQLDAIVTFSNAERIFGQRTIRISNGIDFDAIPLRPHAYKTTLGIHLIGVAEVHYWHGYDRLIRGLAEYYRTDDVLPVYFHIVGQLSGDRERQEILIPLHEYRLTPYVIQHGARHGEELDALFAQAHFAVGSLGRHRSGITHIKTLKNREYAARGFGFIYSEIDDDFEQMPYIIKAPADESPIDIAALVEFARSMTTSPEEIRKSIEPLSWKQQMKKVIDEIIDN